MVKTLLKAEKRNVTRKGLNPLRQEGLLPAVLYGPHIEPIEIQLDAHVAGQILNRLQGTVLIDLDVDGKSYATIVRDVQTDVLRGNLIHVDFLAVDMNKTLIINVPLEQVGDSIAAASGEYAIMTNLFEVQVECLPNNMISVLEVNIENLSELGDTISVSDIDIPEGVNILTDSNETIARVAYSGIVEVEEATEDEEGLDIDAEDVEVIEKGKIADDDSEESGDNDVS